jgi:two-component system phosphate regulon sensor histidine kinase PhoR
VKPNTPRQLAFVIALLTTILTGIIVFLLVKNETRIIMSLVVFLIIIQFVVVFRMIYRWLFDAIYQKINPLYRIIQEQNVPEIQLRNKVKQMGSLNQVNSDVLDWARNKTSEIAKLKQLEKYRREFLGNVSHELKTPIFNIQGYILTLLDGGIDDPDINKLYLEKTEKSINRMISIVEDLESIARLESGELKLQYEEFNIVVLVKEVFELHEMMAQKMNIKLKFSQNYEKGIWVFADRKRIMEVITNLVVNAIKYGRLDGKVLVSFFEMGKSILIEVEDDGIGIPTYDLNRIFERFYRVDKSRSRDQGGTGLGLAIVKHIIEAHKQKINVRSTLNQGTTFSFTLDKA